MAKILIADNDVAVSGLLADVLVRHGLEVVQAYDGDAARSIAARGEIAVLVCDLDMPRTSGLEVIESLALLPAPPAALVISGYLDPSVVTRLRAHDFVRDVLRKPFDLFGFARRVAELAGHGRVFAGPATGE